MTAIPMRNQRGAQVELSGPAATQVARVMMGIGLMFLVGSVVDLAVLWIGQRLPTVQWEFVAITNTAESLPRFALALGLIYLSLFIGHSRSAWAYRLLGGMLVALGVANIALMALLAMDYLAMVGNVNPDGLTAFRSTFTKSFSLTGIYALIALSLGILGTKTAARSAQART